MLLLHALCQKLRPQAQFELLGCELLRLFCSNSHPSNSHSASHRGKAEDDEDDKNEQGRRQKDTDDDEEEDGKGRSHHKEEDEDETDSGTIIFLESPEPDTQGFWRKQNNTTRGSVNLREIGDLRGVS